MWEIFLKLTIKTTEQSNWRRSGVFIVNFKQILQTVLVFRLLTLNKLIVAGIIGAEKANYLILSHGDKSCICSFKTIWNITSIMLRWHFDIC